MTVSADSNHQIQQVWDLTWLCDVLVTPHTVVTTDNEPGG